MMLARCTLSLLALVVVVVSPLQADRRDAGPTRTKGRRDAGPTKATQAKDRRDAGPTTAASKPKLPAKMPMTELAPSKLIPDLCLVRYRVSTTSPECQAFFDQALGYFYSYVWMEAARSFETALQYDAECPLAWWGLSRALERWGKKNHTEALLKASKLKDRASHREQQLILAAHAGEGTCARRRRQRDAQTQGHRHPRQSHRPVRRRRGSVVLPRQLAGGAAIARRSGLVGAVLQGAVAHQSAASRRQSRIAALLRELAASGAGLDLCRELHQIVAGTAARFPHAGAPGHAHRQVGAHHRPLRPCRRTGTRLPQGNERQAERRFAVRASSGDAAAVAHPRWPLRRGPRHRGGGTRLRLQTLAAVVPAASRRARLGGDGQNHRRDTQGPQKRQDDAGLLFGSALSQKGRAARALPEIEVLQHALRDRPNDKTLPFRVWETQGWYMCQTGDAGRGAETALPHRGQDQGRLLAITPGARAPITWNCGASPR